MSVRLFGTSWSLDLGAFRLSFSVSLEERAADPLPVIERRS